MQTFAVTVLMLAVICAAAGPLSAFDLKTHLSQQSDERG